MNKLWNKFKKGYLRLILLTFISVFAGFSLLVYPEETPNFIIRLIGIVWILDGLIHVLEIKNKLLKNKLLKNKLWKKKI